MRPLWCVFTCVRELIWVRLFTSVCVWVWHRVDFNNNALWLNCTGRKGMNSNVKCLLLSIMDGTDTAWWAKLEDFGTMWHTTRDQTGSWGAPAEKKGSLSFPMAAHWNIHQCLEWGAKLCAAGFLCYRTQKSTGTHAMATRLPAYVTHSQLATSADIDLLN